MINKYYLQARLMPTVLTSIPLMIAYFYTVSPYVNKYFSQVPLLPTVGNITLPAALIFLLVQVNRFLSKEIFQKLFFQDELKMPTTNYLMHNNIFFTQETTSQLRSKIAADFSIQLFDAQREVQEETNARK